MVDYKCFYYALHYLGLLFAKSIMGWGGIMTGLPLPQKVAKTAGGLGCLFCWGENGQIGFW